MAPKEYDFDAFISYSIEDKSFARNLATALRDRGVRLWYDEGELRLGDSILRQVEHALERSQFYILLLSPNYMSKSWTQFELGAAMSREATSQKGHVLPIYLHTNPSEIVKFSPTIANIVGIRADDYSVGDIADKITLVIERTKGEAAPNDNAQQ
jgi:hypothetical protein